MMESDDPLLAEFAEMERGRRLRYAPPPNHADAELGAFVRQAFCWGETEPLSTIGPEILIAANLYLKHTAHRWGHP